MPLYQRPTLLNNVTRMLTLPCHENGAVYLELALQAFIDFGIAVADPDPKEVYHHITGEPLVHTIRKGVEDLGDAAGKEPSPVRRAVGKLLGVEDRAIWWYFLMSVGDDALTDATSLGIRMDPCLSGRGKGSGVGYISGIHDGGSYNGINFQFPLGSNYYPVAQAAIRLYEGNNWHGTIACSARYKDLNGRTVGTNCRMMFYPDDGTPNIMLDQFNTLTDDGSPTQNFNHIFRHYQGVPRRDGLLAVEASYTGPPLPSRQAFLSNDSTCFLSGG